MFDLCNSLFETFSFLTADLVCGANVSDCANIAAPLSVFLSKKNYKPLKQDPFDIHHILDF